MKLSPEAQQIKNKAISAIEKLPPEYKAAVIEIGNGLKPVIENIENKPATTKNYYGDYIRVLSYDICKKREKIAAIALIYAGANPEGVAAAVGFLTNK